MDVMANGRKIIIPYRRWENVKFQARFQFWVQEYAMNVTNFIRNVSYMSYEKQNPAKKLCG